MYGSCPRVFSALLLGLALSAVGCKGDPKPTKAAWKVELAKELQADAPNVTVYLVGLQSDEERAEWLAHPVNDLLQSNSALIESKRNEGLVQTVELGSGQPSVTIDREQLQKWRERAWYLAVVANWPRSAPPGPATADTRRRIFPLDSRAWTGVKTINVRITNNGVNIDPAPKPIIK